MTPDEMIACTGCMRRERQLEKLRKENAGLRGKLTQSPIQEMKNMRAEFQEVKERMQCVVNLVSSMNGRMNK